MKIEYIPKRFTPAKLEVIEMANQICREYQNDGYDLTLRQLYYQFVSRLGGAFENSMKSYKRLQATISDARLAGMIDWRAIVDRTRKLQMHYHSASPEAEIKSAAGFFSLNPWNDQDEIVQIWVEKEALLGVVKRAAEKYSVPYFACKGYVSQSELWNAAMRLKSTGKATTILHLGDHDPSGIDMTRDIQDRMNLFGAMNVHVKRIALNMNQVEEFNPPPNPTKLSDTRASGYIEDFGHSCWELDALEPSMMVDLINEHVEQHIDKGAWEETEQEEAKGKLTLRQIADHYPEIVKHFNF